MRSSGSTFFSRSYVALEFPGLFTSAPKPMPVFSVRLRTIFSRPSNAPPQMNRMFVVSTWTKSWLGCLRPPCGGTEAIVPSTSFSNAC
jgi:hypothetical protein